MSTMVKFLFYKNHSWLVWKMDWQYLPAAILFFLSNRTSKLKKKQKKALFIYVFLCLHWVFVAALRSSLVAVSRSYSLVVAHRPLIAAISLVVEHGL